MIFITPEKTYPFVISEISFEAESVLIMDFPVPIFDRPNKFAHEIIVIRANQFPLTFEVISTWDSFKNIVIGKVLYAESIFFPVFEEPS
jgi:hypothetical protein